MTNEIEYQVGQHIVRAMSYEEACAKLDKAYFGRCRTLADAKTALVEVRQTIDSILTWKELSQERREILTQAANHAELALFAVNHAITL